MVCYRRYGHNESDEPAFTLPHMYEVIAQRRSVRKLYTELLVNRGDLTIEEAEKALEDFRLRLEAAFEETRVSHAPKPRASDLTEARTATAATSIETGVARDRLTQIVDALVTFPPGFQVHPKLLRIIGNRRKELDDDRVDWSLAEALAFGSLLLEGTPVRLAGQDTRRGTFSQRHAVLVDHVTEAEYTPLAHLGDSAGAVHGVRLGALGVRGARVRVRLLGRRQRHAGVLGSAVRRLRERRADDHRPVHRRRRRQMG